MSDTVNYVSPQTFITFMAIFLIITLLPTAETVALIRAPRIAGQRAWRQWLALMPILAALAMLTLTILLFIIYKRLTSDSLYTPQAFACNSLGPGGICQQAPLDANITQSLQLYQSVSSAFIWIIIAVFVVAVVGFLILAIGRRQEANLSAVPSSDDAITEP
ncbi:MAG TPA: hypothetical protein VH591_08230 [Ktedonobacterales bacterium]|jgi:ABC-type sugar transport system permease subunit